jgi:hypothetical protein
MEAIIRSTRVRLAALLTSGMLAIGLAAAPAASAQQQGLVNVEISNNNVAIPVTVTVPVNAAANICGVDVDVLSNAVIDNAQPVNCDATAQQHNSITVSPVVG